MVHLFSLIKAQWIKWNKVFKFFINFVSIYVCMIKAWCKLKEGRVEVERVEIRTDLEIGGEFRQDASRPVTRGLPSA